MSTIDAVVLKLPADNAEWYGYCLESLAPEPVNVIEMPGVEGNLGEARKMGFEASSADYVAFVDSDDLVCRGAFEKCKAVLDENPDVSVAYTREAIVTSAGVFMYEIGAQSFEPFLGKPEEAFLAHHLCVYRRSALPDLSFMPQYPAMCDQELRKRMWTPTSFWLVDVVGYQWRQHGGSSSQNLVNYPPHVAGLLREQQEAWGKLR